MTFLKHNDIQENVGGRIFRCQSLYGWKMMKSDASPRKITN